MKRKYLFTKTEVFVYENHLTVAKAFGTNRRSLSELPDRLFILQMQSYD